MYIPAGTIFQIYAGQQDILTIAHINQAGTHSAGNCLRLFTFINLVTQFCQIILIYFSNIHPLLLCTKPVSYLLHFPNI